MRAFERARTATHSRIIILPISGGNKRGQVETGGKDARKQAELNKRKQARKQAETCGNERKQAGIREYTIKC